MISMLSVLHGRIPLEKEEITKTEEIKPKDLERS